MYISVILDLRLVFLLMSLGIAADGFGRPRAGKNHPVLSIIDEHGKIDNRYHMKEKEKICDEYQPYCDCNQVGFGIVQKISYHVKKNDPVIVMFTSGCIRCGLCLAIANKINSTLMDVHEIMPPDRWLEEMEVENFLETTCNNAFMNYGLRDIDGQRYIGDSLPGSTLVKSTADELWEKKLRERCLEIVQIYGARKLYNHWRGWCGDLNEDLESILCNGRFEILRDCRGIENGFQMNLQEPQRAKIRIKAAFKCA